MVDLSNVDNTSDADKPVSTAQQAALDLKAPINITRFTPGPTNLSVSDNAVTITNSYHTLSCSTSTTTLSTINGNNISVGSLLYLDVDFFKTITVNDDENILLTQSPYVMTINNSLTLIKKNIGWVELYRTTLPPTVVRDVNGVTYKFVGTVPENATNPFFIRGYDNNQYYAVMKNTGSYIYNSPSDSVNIIKNYANGSNTNPFIHNGQVIPFERIVTTLMTSFEGLFFYNRTFNGNVTTWDTSNVTTFKSAFQVSEFDGAGLFNQDISKWNTSNVTNMDYFLSNQLQFDQDISGWNVDNVIMTDYDKNILQNNMKPNSKRPPKFRLNPQLNNFQSMNKQNGDIFVLTPPNSFSSGSFTYTSSNQSVATISGNTVTVVGAGQTTITAIQAYDLNYRSASITATLTVS